MNSPRADFWSTKWKNARKFTFLNFLYLNLEKSDREATGNYRSNPILESSLGPDLGTTNKTWSFVGTDRRCWQLVWWTVRESLAWWFLEKTSLNSSFCHWICLALNKFSALFLAFKLASRYPENFEVLSSKINVRIGDKIDAFITWSV